MAFLSSTNFGSLVAISQKRICVKIETTIKKSTDDHDWPKVSQKFVQCLPLKRVLPEFVFIFITVDILKKMIISKQTLMKQKEKPTYNPKTNIYGIHNLRTNKDDGYQVS